ncbi:MULTISPECIES: hypothetical protein [unclassified Pseudomonas]|uniref:hypothetical protein n=1 Tax=unclassified Pseudomonas TaxID=196821 RepID=UPI0024493329|nr:MULTISPECIES: hypothetical protein [unclassified Pseudomonas]MDH0303448.1 hypothetical protein [Pseudomonas sp. GD04091]MDH1984485.1 hypothetical protein [Pseudomonas sp. GD03689]
MSARPSGQIPPVRIVRPKLFWRLLFVQVCLLAAFLYVGFMSLGGYLFMLGLDAQHPQRYMALGGGALILLVGLWLLKVAMPRRLTPSIMERDR